MNQASRNFAGASLLFALTACTSGNTAIPPSQTGPNPLANGKLQFAVGTANIGGTAGLNTVVTYRKADGTSAVLVSTPAIVGPAGFVVPSTTDPMTGALLAGNDAGTNSITGSPQPTVGTAAAPTTFGASGGAFGYGFQPDNATTSGSASFSRYPLPFYTTGRQLRYIAGPPAFPQTRDGNYATGFAGWTLGFTDFLATPVAGTYALNLTVPTGFDKNGNATSGVVSTSANLGSTALLPTFAPPTFTPDGAGGGTASVTVPAGVIDAYVIIVDSVAGATDCFPGTQSRPVYYALHTTTAGAQALTLPANLGPTGPGFANTRSLCSGDAYRIYAVGFDYDATGAAPPTSTSIAPTIVGANGQADVTTSLSTALSYP